MTTRNPLAACLSERNGHLWVEDIDTTDLVERFGTPLFVLSERQLRANARDHRKAFADHWPDGPVDLMPAVKANWARAVWAVLAGEGLGADVYSEGELHTVLGPDIPRDRISVNGGGKSDEMLRLCIENDVRLTVEDLDEPERIDRIAGELGKTAKVRFRVKPNFPNLWRKSDFAIESVSIDLGIQVYKSGIPAQYLEDLGRSVLKMKNVELVGLHFHGGRHSKELWYWRGLMRNYAELVLRLCRAWGGWRPQELDIGGGFASYADPHSRLKPRKEAVATFLTYPLELLAHLATTAGRYRLLQVAIETIMPKTPGTEHAPTIEDYARVAVGTFRRTLSEGGLDLDGIRLQVEPGRSFFGNTGIHLTRVKAFKRQADPIRLNWVLTDTTYFFMSGGVIEYDLHDFRIANKTDAPARHVADVVGHSCYGDRILPTVRVPDLERGDIVALLDMGAYQEVSASNFNALPRPPVVLVDGADAEIVKRGETIAEVYSRDVVPERLTARGAATEDRK